MSWDKKLPDRQTARLKWFDYSQAGSYFVTIGTYKGHHTFGGVEDGKMSLNAAGWIAQAEWLKLSERFLGVQLDEYVIMPNHLHGIIIIPEGTTIANAPERFRAHMHRMAEERIPQLKKPYQAPTLGKIIGTYKGATARLIRLSGAIDFAWQERYFDSIIRDDRALQAMRRYMVNNPQSWRDDRLYTPKAHGEK